MGRRARDPLRRGDPHRTTAVAYIGGVGAGDGFREAFRTELARRLGPDPDPASERERSIRQWTADYSPGPAAAGHARALWDTKPDGATINMDSNRQLWADRSTEDLCLAAARVTCPVTMLSGADDPRPWTATDSLLAALPDARRIVLEHAGHSPWVERPADTRRLLIDALR